MSESQDKTKLDWFPLYFHRLKASSAWNMPDYQFAWYFKLLIESADSPIPGYLPASTDKLWRLAGAKSQSYFEKWGGCELVSKLFCRTEIEGQGWIYNKRMIQVLYQQHDKLSKRERKRCSSLSLSLQVVPDWIPQETFHEYVQMRDKIKKPLTGNAVKLAYRKLEKLKSEGHDPKDVLEQSIFRSWAGLFPVEQVTNGRAGTVNAGPSNYAGDGRKTPGQSLADENCLACKGSGFVTVAGKADRCECWKRNRAALAKAAGAS